MTKTSNKISAEQLREYLNSRGANLAQSAPRSRRDAWLWVASLLLGLFAYTFFSGFLYRQGLKEAIDPILFVGLAIASFFTTNSAWWSNWVKNFAIAWGGGELFLKLLMMGANRG